MNANKIIYHFSKLFVQLAMTISLAGYDNLEVKVCIKQMGIFCRGVQFLSKATKTEKQTRQIQQKNMNRNSHWKNNNNEHEIIKNK